MDKASLIDLFKKCGLKTSVIFGAFGFFISLIIVLIKGDDISDIIIRPLISGFIMGAIWTFAYHFVQKYAPDFISEIETIFPKSKKVGFESSDNFASSEKSEGNDKFNFELDKSETNAEGDFQEDENKSEKISEDIKINMSDSERKINAAKPKTKAGKDEMMVQGVPLKKDPELMARAIQHVLDKDQD